MRLQALDTVRRALNIDESRKASKASRARDAALKNLLIRVLDTNVPDCRYAGKGWPIGQAGLIISSLQH